MKVITFIETNLAPGVAEKLAKVRTQNTKEIHNSVVMMINPDMDALPADIRAIGREVETLTRIENEAHARALQLISEAAQKMLSTQKPTRIMHIQV